MQVVMGILPQFPMDGG